MNNYLLIITLNVNGLNSRIKRHRVAEWIRKHDPHICCLQETHLRKKRPTQTESEGLERNFPSKWTGKKKAGIAILLSDKIDFQRRAIKRDPEGHLIIFKERIHQEDRNIVNIYAPNRAAPKHIKKILEDFKKDIDSNNYSRGFQHPTIKNGQVFQTKYQEEYCVT